VLHLAEIPLAHAQQHGAIELRVAADEVVDAGVERAAILVVPGLRRLVAIGDEHRLAVPVLPLARQEIAALQQQDARAGRREGVRKRAAARAGSNDDDVVAVF
jgi:hypothetical protein